MTRQLPPRPDLDHLRREARGLQSACLAGDVRAIARLTAVFAEADAASLPLTRAQAVVAREHGFPGWPALAAGVEARRAASPGPSDADVLAEQWFGLAEAEDLRPLTRALAVTKALRAAARARMRREPARYAAFQQALLRGLAARRERVRFASAAALADFGDAATRAPLAQLLDDPVPRVRWVAMFALTFDARAPLEPDYRARIAQAALSDPSVRVRHHAGVRLGLLGDAAAAPLLRQMLARETDPRLLRGVAWALAELERAPQPDKPRSAGL